MTALPAMISALCALLGTLAGFCATVRRQAADMAEIRSRLDCLTELGEELRREQRRMAELSVEIIQRLAREEEAVAQAHRRLDRFVN